jgi:aerobic carbon-monoxide dehydrogenase medium subunit
VKPAPFDYHRAVSVDDAVDALATTGGKVLAGGQSLVPLMSMRLASPSALVDINHVGGLSDVTVDRDRVRIGALTRHRQLELNDSAYRANTLLRQAVTSVAHETIRNRGTTVGSLVHADPAAEMPAVLRLLGGSVDVVSRERGARTIGADELFVGPLESALAPDELAVSAAFPNPPPGAGTAWVELSRRHGDYALVGAGAVVETDGDVVSSARVGLISVGSTPVVVDVTAAAAGSSYRDVDWTDAQALVEESIDPETDIHASADYRRQLARVLATRALGEATRRAGR